MPDRRRSRTGVARDVARAIKAAPAAGPLVQARRKVVQHLADALEDAMRAGSDLLVVKLNGQLEAAIRRAELEPAASRGGVTPDGDNGPRERSLDDELAELAAREPAMGDAPAS